MTVEAPPAPITVEAPPSPTAAGTLLRRHRGLLVCLALLVGVALLLGWVASGQRRGYLDPEGIDRSGGRALVQLLEAQGVEVVPARRLAEVERAVADAGAATTVLLTVPDRLGEDGAARVLATGADLVLLATGGPEVFVPGAVAQPAAVEDLRPDCRLAVAERAGEVLLGGTAYALEDGDATGCYPTGGGASLLEVEADGRRTTLVGAPQPFTNEHLDTDGNAALALGLLGEHPTLVWYRPVIEQLPGEGRSLGSLLPGWVGPVALQLLVVAALAGLWRGRRLGPLVREPLPVAVPAAEAVRGRARLYRRSRSVDHAAQVLRRASGVRLRSVLHLPPGAGADDRDLAVVAAVRSGRRAGEVAALLTGPPPSDEAGLVRLASDLDRLEEEVRRA